MDTGYLLQGGNILVTLWVLRVVVQLKVGQAVTRSKLIALQDMTHQQLDTLESRVEKIERLIEDS